MRTTEWDSWVERARGVRIEDEAARRGIKLNGKAGTNERCGPCPKCGGEDRFSINIKKGVFNCRGCGKGGDVIALVQHLDSCVFAAAVETLTGEPPPKSNGKDRDSRKDRADGARKMVAETHPYRDAEGELRLVVERIEYRLPDGSFITTASGKRKKTFRQKRPDFDRPGEWIWDTDGVPPLIYHLPEVTEAIATERTILIVEGKRKAELLWTWDVPATCCPGGARKWRAEHSEHLRGSDVVVLPDNDARGREHVDAVASSLIGVAKRVRILKLPGLPPKGDIVDWAAAGGTREDLDRLIEQATDVASADEGEADTAETGSHEEANDQPSRTRRGARGVPALARQGLRPRHPRRHAGGGRRRALTAAY